MKTQNKNEHTNTKPSCITIITDCHDVNARSRQVSRWASFFPGSHISFIPLGNTTIDTVGLAHTLSSAGICIDTLDALEERSGIICINIAPRHGSAKKWENGTPFIRFWIENKLIIAPIGSPILSTLKKFNLINKEEHISIISIKKAKDIFFEKGYISKEKKESLLTTQFRSFEVLPRAGAHLWDFEHIEKTEERSKEKAIKRQEESSYLKLCENERELESKDIPHVWWVDNFGNIKTSLISSEENISFLKSFLNKKYKIDFSYYERLKDVPNSSPALITGSSGYENRRFIEIVIQGKSAALEYKLSIGSSLSFKNIKNI